MGVSFPPFMRFSSGPQGGGVLLDAVGCIAFDPLELSLAQDSRARCLLMVHDTPVWESDFRLPCFRAARREDAGSSASRRRPPI